MRTDKKKPFRVLSICAAAIACFAVLTTLTACGAAPLGSAPVSKSVPVPTSAPASVQAPAPATAASQAPNTQPPRDITFISLTIENCNVTVKNTDEKEIRYEYDENKFTVTRQIYDVDIRIHVEPLADTMLESSINEVVIYLPSQEFEEIIVVGDNAGVALKALNTDLHLSNYNGSMSVQVPEGFDKTIEFFSVNGSGLLAIDKDAEDYLLMLSAKDSAVSISPGFPAFTPGEVWEHQNGNGAAKINMTLQDSSFSIALSDGADDEEEASRAESLSQNFELYEPFGLVYDARQDALYYSGERVKLFVDFKEDKESGVDYAFDLCYRDLEADGNLYLMAVEDRDSGGQVTGVRLLAEIIAHDILGEMALADSGEASDVV